MRRRLRISQRDLQYLLAFALIATIAASGVAYRILNPAPSEQFFAMWILGSNGLAEHYYPHDNSTIPLGEQVSWTIGVYNHMADLAYVVVEVKLLNSTSTSPDELTGAPSPVSEIFEFRHVLVDNETWSMPFVWKLLNLTSRGSSILLTGLSINQATVSGTLGGAKSGMNFRLVFELWFYDQNGKLSFSWSSGGAAHSVWTQIWFNATSTS